jgi:hypothetical protein
VGALGFWLLGAIVIILGGYTTSLRALVEGLRSWSLNTINYSIKGSLNIMLDAEGA